MGEVERFTVERGYRPAFCRYLFLPGHRHRTRDGMQFRTENRKLRSSLGVLGNLIIEKGYEHPREKNVQENLSCELFEGELVHEGWSTLPA